MEIVRQLVRLTEIIGVKLHLGKTTTPEPTTKVPETTTPQVTTTKAPETTTPQVTTTKVPETTTSQVTTTKAPTTTPQVTTTKIPETTLQVTTSKVLETTTTFEPEQRSTTSFSETISTVQNDGQTITVNRGAIKKAKRISGKKAKIRIKKIEGVKNYQVKYSTKKSFKKKYTKTINVRKLNFVIKKLKVNKKYYIKVRGYIVKDEMKIYGKWSKKKTLKTNNVF